MKELLNLISVIGMLALCIGLTIFGIYIRFANPDMTETRLFLTYWKEIIGGISLFLALAMAKQATE